MKQKENREISIPTSTSANLTVRMDNYLRNHLGGKIHPELATVAVKYTVLEHKMNNYLRDHLEAKTWKELMTPDPKAKS
ncbi:MAG: hypothetical protein V1744_02425 [Candidatus Altiarchaeota archaeon]